MRRSDFVRSEAAICRFEVCGELTRNARWFRVLRVRGNVSKPKLTGHMFRSSGMLHVTFDLFNGL